MRKPLLSELTLREKIGQTALGRVNAPGLRNLDKYPYGSFWANGDFTFGVIMDEVDETIEKRGKWVANVKAINSRLKVPIIHAGDCETTVPPKEYGYVLDPLSVGATGSEEYAYKTGLIRGKMLRSVGTNWVWSPVCDLPSRDNSSILGRTYTDDPDKLLKMNIATMKGFQDAGIAACAKHFPGEDGMEYRDAHFSETKNLSTKEEWLAKQGRVFQGMIDAGVDTIMTAHQCFPAIDNTTRNGRYVPATLSKKILIDLLKGEMGFKGVVITDDVWMRSVGTYCNDDTGRVYVECIKAGNDVVLGVKDFYFDVIEEAVLNGEIPMERIDDACQRVLDLKEKLGVFEDDFEHILGDVDEINAEAAAFNKEAAAKSISLVCDKSNLFPLSSQKYKKVCIIYSGHDAEGENKGYDSMKNFIKEFEKRGCQVTFVKGLLKSFASEADLREIADTHDLIVYAGFLKRWTPHGKSGFYGVEVSTFQNALRAGFEKSLGVGIGSPFMYYDFYSAFPTFINIYNYFPENIEAAVAAMFGEIPFEGGEPFKLIPDYVKERLEMFGAVEEQM